MRSPEGRGGHAAGGNRSSGLYENRDYSNSIMDFTMMQREGGEGSSHEGFTTWVLYFSLANKEDAFYRRLRNGRGKRLYSPIVAKRGATFHLSQGERRSAISLVVLYFCVRRVLAVQGHRQSFITCVLSG